MSEEDIVFTTKYHNQNIVDKFGKLEHKKYICVLDLELTCWADEDEEVKFRGEEEIIEIGVVVLENKRKYKKIDEFYTFVKPAVHKELSQYCTSLTGIIQENVDTALPLKDAILTLLESEQLPDPKEFVWSAWGDDAKWLQQELIDKGAGFIQFDPRVLNLKVYQKLRGRSCGLKEALRLANIPQEIPVHRALPDAKSTANLLRYMKLRPTDALVSKEKSYKETVNRIKKERSVSFSKKYDLEEDKAFKLLQCVGWNKQRALHILRIFRS